MPTYSYRCTECGHAFDVHQAFTDASLTECPECGGRLRKVFGNLGITFNGSGFYRTDSRSTGGGKSDSSGAGSSEKSGNSGSGESGSSSGAKKESASTAGSTGSTTA